MRNTRSTSEKLQVIADKAEKQRANVFDDATDGLTEVERGSKRISTYLLYMSSELADAVKCVLNGKHLNHFKLIFII